MADEIPVWDLLREATEYLSKLGTNLRTRSVNLKEKRMRKEQLKNSHAVRKAADKVLLICELSKKSIVDVENCMKKVLSVVKTTQSTSSGGKNTSMSNKIEEEKCNYYYFEYDSCKLRISKKISLKHFMSVKVMSRPIPMSMQDKYPVYHDCKLYRLRKKKEQVSLKNNIDIYQKSTTDIGHNTNSRKVMENIDKNQGENDVQNVMENVSKDILQKDDFQKNTHDSDSDSNMSRNSTKLLKTDLTNTKKNKKKRKKSLVIDDSDNDIDNADIPLCETEPSQRLHSETNECEEKGSQNTENMEKKSTSQVHDSDGDSNIGEVPLSEVSTSKNHITETKDDNEMESKECNQKEYNSYGNSTNSDKPISAIETSKNTLSGDNEKPDTIETKRSKNKKSSLLYDSDDSTNADTQMSEKHTKKHSSDKSDGDESDDSCIKKRKKKRLSLRNDSEDDSKNANEPKTEVRKSSPKDFRANKKKKKHRSDVKADGNHSDSSNKSVLKERSDLNNDDVITLDDTVIALDDTVSDTEKNCSSSMHSKKKRKLDKSDVMDRELLKNSEESDTGQRSDSNSSVKMEKPIIKCVSLNKLLKPDLVNKYVDKSQKKTSQKFKITIRKSRKTVEISSDDDEEEKYWAQKKEEVKKFKQKQFVIKVIRLPEITLKLLVDYNLKRIIHKNKIICEIDGEVNEVKNALLIDSDADKSYTQNNPKMIDEAEIVKTALLHESDSDKPEKDCSKKSLDNEQDINNEVRNLETEKDVREEQENQEKHKSALLFTSDSEDNCNKEKNQANEETSQFDSLHHANNIESDNLEDKAGPSSVTEKNNEDEKNSSGQKDAEEIKTALLNSSDYTSESPGKKRKRANPHSKRKHIMESMRAKKMLLTYSSSSETEDEQLRSVLKDIKDSLLKGGSSSDDEKNQKRDTHKSQSTSDFEDNEKDEELSTARLSTDSKNRQSSDSKNCSGNESETKSSKSNDNCDKQSSSSSSKMGRSVMKAGDSSQNSDTQDDKDVDGLTNLSSLHKVRRRRGSTSTGSRRSRRITRRRRMSKSPLINQENMLQAESSSDEAGSGAESECGEDLPSVSLSGLNGDGIGHIAKDDLLDESDSSSSHVAKDNDSEEIKKEDSDEENVKLKRRKAHAISSDSETGSSRKKGKDVKTSDFEDSEEESSEPAKKSKRKKKESDSDGSDGESNDGNKKKRRRIKQVDSDGSDGSDTENEGRNKHGRKNIRKVMGKSQLEEATKKAAREEKERIARIAERQKMYNNLEFDESGKPDEVVLEKVVLDFDPETKEPLIEVDRGLVKKLKPHQANGIKFMWNACFESVKRIKKDKGSGCILAHCMGLGKTLQVVSLAHTLLAARALTGVRRVLVVCPLSTVLNWVNEFRIWLKHAAAHNDLDIYELSRYKQNSERAFQLQQWCDGGGVCVLGYEMFRNLSADNAKKFKKKMLRVFQESLVDPGPDLVVCDEGHLLKNEKTSLSQSMNRVKTQRRIVLTGTPLQNNLKEYYCMVQFVKPNLLGKYNEYLNRFVNPITNGQYTDSTEHDIRVMKRRSHVLHKMLDGAVQRRDYGVLAPFLPPKHEYVLFITLTEVQIKLYQYYLDNYSRRPLPGKSSGFLFPDFQSLQRIWTHPLVLKYNSERYEIMQQKKREREEEDSEGSLADFIDDDSTPDETTTDESSDDSSDMSDDSHKKNKKKKSSKKNKKDNNKASTRLGTRANPVELEDEDIPEVFIEAKNENPTEWWIKLVTDDEIEDMRNSHKLVLLFDILRQCEAIGDKLLVFSQSLYSLDLIEHFLGKVDEATQEGRIDEKLGGHVGSWSPGIDYFRLDGSTSCENRSIWCKNFNREDNPRARLFLISTRAGGLGINLVAANRVVIFDVSWNPSHDVQSIFRVYRFGQKKPCYIYRFLAMGTMEEKIYERQVTKQAISKRVIDEQQIDRHYAENDLAELYKFEATPPTPRPLPPLPKDRLFAEMLKEHEAQIYKYHEHDSLLENKEEETLSEEERKAAWEDFENEKNRPPPAPFPSAWPMHNGMVPGLIAQQQQQLAYAALAAMLRKDIPNINDNQIRDMLPLIYNSNPQMFGGYDYGVMQKMNEIYKYAQPGMMNPGMMNPVMNPGGGGGMGGSSGLQYEPPWQRQQQQQQQIRLQQLLQQQQNMGAKYYAGGLGSRDPVAMALQQQRAREIMVGERAEPRDRARPRGRPPLQPRAPPHAPSHAPSHAPADVVNLDSD